MKLRLLVIAALSFLGVTTARADTISIGAYNVEHFAESFAGFHNAATTRKAASQPGAVQPVATQPGATQPYTTQHSAMLNQMIDEEKRQNDEDHWEVARVILDPNFNPDILLIEEGCAQSDLDFFNKRWLSENYATCIQFESNTGRDQHLNMLIKPGFRVVERRDKYYLEPDKTGNERGQRLFARGPVFVQIETPTGYRLWVGLTHQKSKSGNNLEVTQWRNRESVRTHEIMKELQKEGPKDVILLGDMNDDVGLDKFEQEPGSGGDSIANLVGPKQDGFFLVTQPLVEASEQSFGGYWRTEYRSLIDHAVASASMRPKIADVKVFKSDIASVASDHYPLLVKVRADAPGSDKKAPPPPLQVPVPTGTDDRQ